MNKENMSNDLIVSVDWLSFTLFGFECVEDVISFMGFDTEHFKEMPRGANGYKRMRKYVEYNISVLYDGSDDMGMHVNISGTGICALLSAFRETLKTDTPFGSGYNYWSDTVLAVFLNKIQENGHFTRIDLAIDDIGAKYYTVDEVLKKQESQCIVTKFRTYRHTSENETIDNEKKGQTLYYGSRQSDIMLRIYDKKLEQNRGLCSKDDGYIDYEWVRWELQLSGERANNVTQSLIKELPLGEVAIGVLYHYFRIIRLDDLNRSRCSNEKKWECFVGNVEKLRLFVAPRKKTLEDKFNWVDKQVGPTLATILYASGGDRDILNSIAMKNEHRISKSDRELLGSDY